MDIIIEVAETLELELEDDVRQDRRRLLRAISNHIESEEFDDLGQDAVRRIDDIHAHLILHFRDLMPPNVPPVPGVQDVAPQGLQMDGDGLGEGDNGLQMDGDEVDEEDAGLFGDGPPVLQLAPHLM